MSYDIGPKIGIDGEKEFRDQLKNITEQYKTLQAQERKLAAEFEDTEDSMESLSAQNRLYANETKKLNEKLELQSKMLEEAAKKYGESATETLKWQRAVTDTETELAKLNNRQKANEKAMEDLERATDDAGDEMKDLENAADDAGDELEDLTGKAGKAEKGMLGFKDVFSANVLADFATDALKNAGRALVDFAKEAIETASDLEEVQNVIDVTFGENNRSIETFAKDAAKNFGIAELQAKQALGTIGAMMKSMGMADDVVEDMSESLVGLAADMGSFYNLDFETAFAKIRSGISGQTEPLKQLGINMSEANLAAFALSEGLEKTYSQMSAAEKTQLRYNYLLQATADAQGDFARTADSYANKSKLLDLEIQNLTADIGEKLLPAATRAKETLIGFLEEINKATDFSIETQKFSTSDFFDITAPEEDNPFRMWVVEAEAATEANNNFGESASAAAEKTSEFEGELSDTTPTIAEYEEEMLALSDTYTAAYDEARKNIEGQIKLFQEMDKATSISVSDMIKSLNDQAKYMDTYAENIRKAAELGIDQGLLQKLSDGSVESAAILQEIVDDSGGSMDELNEAFRRVEEGKEDFSHTVAQMSQEFKQQLANMVSQGKVTLKGLDMYAQTYQDGKNTMQGYINGINAMMPSLRAAASQAASIPSTTARKVNDQHSPSRVMRKIGNYDMQGYELGWLDEEQNMIGTMDHLARVGQKTIMQTNKSYSDGMSSLLPPVQTSQTAATAVSDRAGTAGGITAETLAAAISMALNGTRVDMDGMRVGRMVTTYQRNAERASG